MLCSPRVKFNCLAVPFLAIFATTNLAQTASSDLAIAFRYDKNHVISHVAYMEDPVKISNPKPSKEPVTRDSNCGYQLPLTVERLRTFKPLDGKVPAIGQKFIVFLGGNATITATVEGYIEDWHGDPRVGISMIALVESRDQSRFEKTESGYFLISSQGKPALPASISDPFAGVEIKTRSVLNRFGTLGDLIERTAEAGRDIRLYRISQGTLRPTNVEDGCSD